MKHKQADLKEAEDYWDYCLWRSKARKGLLTRYSKDNKLFAIKRINEWYRKDQRWAKL